MKEKIMKNFGYIIVLLDLSIYFILSYIFIDDFQGNILKILIGGALLFVSAITATSAMMKQGMLIGKDNEKYQATLKAHVNQKQKIFPKLNKLQPWLDKNYIDLIKIGRTEYVSSAGYEYSKVFDAEGRTITSFRVEKPDPKIYKKWYSKTIFLPFLKLFRWLFSDDWKLYREKKRYIQKARRYKITRLTVSHLLNVDAERDPNNFGITESQYAKRHNSFNVISRLVFSILLQTVVFGFNGFNMTTFLVQMLNVVLILISAFFELFQAYAFMVKTHRDTVIKKINKLEEFDAAVKEDKSHDEVKDEKLDQEVDNAIHTEIPVRTESSVVEKIQ